MNQPQSTPSSQLFTVTTLAGLEPVLRQELSSLGLSEVSAAPQAITVAGGKAEVYRCLYALRTALRVLVHIAEFSAKDPEAVYREAARVRWERYLRADQTFAVDATATSTHFRNPAYTALKVKDAIADHFRRQTGRRPSVQTDYPDLRLHLHIDDVRCTLSRDAAGVSLHRRGYRGRAGEAPLNEALAAGLLLLSGWQFDAPLIDPFCGSGTIVIEAAMMRAGIAPGAVRRRLGSGAGARRSAGQGGRKRVTGGRSHTPIAKDRPPYGCQTWPDFDAAVWGSVASEAGLSGAEGPPTIIGIDQSAEAVAAASDNAERAGVGSLVRFERGDARDLGRSTLPSDIPGWIVTNPPYGERLAQEAIGELYRRFGDALKASFHGYHAWILSGSFAGLKRVGLRSEGRIPLRNGPIECRFVHFPLHGRGREASGSGNTTENEE